MVKACRWITIATYRGKFILVRNCGFMGLELSWRGRLRPFQPWEFVTWPAVYDAVYHRLSIAGLQLVSFATVVYPDDGQGDRSLVCEVMRKPGRNEPRKHER